MCDDAGVEGLRITRGSDRVWNVRRTQLDRFHRVVLASITLPGMMSGQYSPEPVLQFTEPAWPSVSVVGAKANWDL